MTEAVILGLDGLDPRWFKYHIAQGECPNVTENVDDIELKDIDSHRIDTHKQPYTPAAWSTIYTGVVPKLHGVTATPFDIPNFDFREDLSDTIFDDFSNAGWSVGSFRMPMTWPARPVNGWMVSGFPSGNRSDVEPNETEVFNVDTEQLDLFHKIEENKIGDRDGSLASYARKEEMGAEMFLDIQNGEDILFYGSQVPDKLGHEWFDNFGEMGENINHIPKDERDFLSSRECLAASQSADMLIGEVINEIDPEYLFLVSDHGITRYSQDEKYHSMHSIAIEYRKSDSPDLSGVESIIDIRDHVLDVLGVDKTKEPFETDESNEEEITDEEMEDVEERLEDMGYM